MIKDPKNIEDWKAKTFKNRNKTAANAQLLDENRLIAKISFLKQILNADKDFSNAELVAASTAGSEADINIDDIDKTNLISSLLATDANKT